MIEAVTEVAKKYEGFLNESTTEEHKIVMLPTGSALIIDAKKYQTLLEEGIQLSLTEPAFPSVQRIFSPVIW